MRDDIAREHAFAADVYPARTLDVALHLAHDDDFLSDNVRRDGSVAADGDAIVGEANGAFDASVNEKRFRTRHVTLDDKRASDVGLIHGCGGRLDRSVTVWGRDCVWRVLGFRRLQHE